MTDTTPPDDLNAPPANRKLLEELHPGRWSDGTWMVVFVGGILLAAVIWYATR